MKLLKDWFWKTIGFSRYISEMNRIEDSIKFQIRDIEAIHQDFIRIEDKLEKMWNILKRWE